MRRVTSGSCTERTRVMTIPPQSPMRFEPVTPYATNAPSRIGGRAARSAEIHSRPPTKLLRKVIATMTASRSTWFVTHSPRQEAEDRLEIVVEAPDSPHVDRPRAGELPQRPVEDVRGAGLGQDLVRRRERHVGDVIPSGEHPPEVPGCPGRD